MKTYENENKTLKNINESLSTTLNQLKIEQSTMIDNLKGQVTLKDKDLNRVYNELQDKNKSIDKVLEKERENIEYKVQIMQNTIDQLKNDLMNKTSNYNEINQDNKRLLSENQQLKRKINLLKDHEVDLEHDNKN